MDRKQKRSFTLVNIININHTNPVQFPWGNLVTMQSSKDALACIKSFMHLKSSNLNLHKCQDRHLQEGNITEVLHTLPGVDVTEITYQPSLSRSNRFNSKDTSYVNPRESRTVVNSLGEPKVHFNRNSNITARNGEIRIPLGYSKGNKLHK